MQHSVVIILILEWIYIYIYMYIMQFEKWRDDIVTIERTEVQIVKKKWS